MVNHAQDLMSVKKFFDLPNKLLPNKYIIAFWHLVCCPRHIHNLHINQHLSPQWTSSADHVDCSFLSHAVEHATIPDCEGYSWLLVFLHNLLRFSGKTEIHSQAPYLFFILI